MSGTPGFTWHKAPSSTQSPVSHGIVGYSSWSPFWLLQANGGGWKRGIHVIVTQDEVLRDPINVDIEHLSHTRGSG